MQIQDGAEEKALYIQFSISYKCSNNSAKCRHPTESPWMIVPDERLPASSGKNNIKKVINKDDKK